ncbi:SRSF protein kinase 1-like isoform X2 [Ptychodera flava]|uniref:SRSF protein kinase 1-like isoform X2 n=1 Tax=Ptychodera flava TaxID=63121 RepID=UPI00396AA1CE
MPAIVSHLDSAEPDNKYSSNSYDYAGAAVTADSQQQQQQEPQQYQQQQQPQQQRHSQYVEDHFKDDEEEEILGSDDEEQEDSADYCKGGYHAVKIGDLFHNRYHVVRKLGWGHFSTVWLAWDLNGKRYVALKVVKSAQHYTETALDEIKLLKSVRESDESDPYREKVVQLLDDFKISGQNGVHVCMVFEVLGHNLLKPIIKSNYMGLPLLTVKVIIKQVLQGLDYLHKKCQIIHTDIKPENILMSVDDEYVRKLAAEACSWVQYGLQPPNSSISTAPVEKKPQGKMSKNKKKKLKKKQKRQLELIEKQKAQLQELDLNPDNVTEESNQRGQGDDSQTDTNDQSVKEVEQRQTDDKDEEKQTDDKENEETAESPVDSKGEEIVQNENTGDVTDDIAEEKPADIAEEGMDCGSKCADVQEKEPATETAEAATSAVDESLPDIVTDSMRDNADEKIDDTQGEGIADNEVFVDCSDKVAECEEYPQSKENTASNGEQLSESTDESKTANNNDGGNTEDVTNSEQTVIPTEMRNGHIDNKPDCINEDAQSVNKQNNESTQLYMKNEENQFYSLENDIIASDGNQTNNLESNIDFEELKDLQQLQEVDACLKDKMDDNEEPLRAEVNASPSVKFEEELALADVANSDAQQKAEDKCTSPDPPPLQVKIADLGNACWVHHHFTEDIQTRQYRALEVILGAGYSTPADIWSTACMAFELATGDYLFEPHSGENYSRDEDHIAHIIELLGPVPRSLTSSGKYSREFFTKRGELRHIHKLKPWDLYHVLVEKYEWNHLEAEEFTSFLMPMLQTTPERRATAAECLSHPWLADVEV